MANDDDYLARELVQIVVGVLGVHQVATLSSEVIGDLVHHIKQFIAAAPSREPGVSAAPPLRLTTRR